MAEYTVIKPFRDILHQVSYMPGDVYPRHDRAATVERIAELLSDKNAQKTPLIKRNVTVDAEAENQTEQAAPVVSKRGRKPKKQVTEDVD